MARYRTGAHTRHRLLYHMVWIPKYRKRVLKGKIAVRLKRLLYDGCKINDWWISEVSVQEDHIHVVIQLNAADSVAGAIQKLKGGTSRIIRKEYPELEEFLWGDSFWADGYFAETVGTVNEEVIRKYVRDQRS